MNFNDSNLTNILNRLEIACITGNFLDNEYKIDAELYRGTNYDYECIKDIDTLIGQIVNHNYDKVLNTEFSCLKSLKERSKDFTFVFYEKNGEIKSNYQHLYHSFEEDCPYVKQLTLLLIAVSALQEFVKANICGPTAHLESEYAICDSLLPNSRYSDECILDALSQDGEVILTKIIHPKLLFLSLLLFFANNFNKCLTHRWWLFRGTMIHQRILPDRMADLHSLVTSLIAKQQNAKFLKNKGEPLAEVMFYVECAYAHLYYYEFNIAEKYILSAQNVLGLGIKLIHRPITEWSSQNYDICRVLVKVKRNDSRYLSNLTLTQCVFPSSHYDVTLCEHIIMTDNNGERITDLLPEEQIILLTYCELIRERSEIVSSKLEILSLTNILLCQPKIWAIQCKALFVQAQNLYPMDIKRGKYRNQIKELLTSIKKNTPQFALRQNFLYCVSLPMKYTLKKFLADKLLQLRDSQNALLLYKKLNLWSGAVKCYQNMNAISKGVRDLNSQIASRPCSILWCYLGDLTDNPDVYKVAWKLSRYSNARSQRCLGYYCFKREMYKESIYHFKKSLIVNYLQPKVLFAMGLAAKLCNDTDVAIDAFTTVLKIDQNNFEAWSYLVKAYIEKNEKVEACRCLLDGMRRYKGHDSWENYLLVSAHINSFSDVINGYNTLLDDENYFVYKSSRIEMHLDILDLLVNSICSDTPDINNIPSTYLKTEALLLFRNLTSDSLVSSPPQIWELYANLLLVGHGDKVCGHAISCQHQAVSHYNDIAISKKSEKDYIVLLKAALKYVYMFHNRLKYLPSCDHQQLLPYSSCLVHDILINVNEFKDSISSSAELIDLLSSLKSAFNRIFRK